MKVYAVGGSVRDAQMGVPNSDRDFVVVGATAEELLSMGYKNVGESFPVFLHPETGDEYALARREVKTGAGYRGFSVEFDPSITLAEDLSRRDLTINAMALDLDTGELVDPFNGMADLEAKVLRHVGSAFVEDPLRVVRLARFFARFTGFTIADDTMELARQIVASGEMDTLAAERFWAEMEKVFETSKTPMRFFVALRQMGVLQNVKFFKELFGDITLNEFNVEFPAFLDRVVRVNTEKRLPYFLALAAHHGSMNSHVIPGHVKNLRRNLKTVRNMGEVTAAKVMDLFKRNRAFDENPMHMHDLFQVMALAELSGEGLPVGSWTLMNMLANARTVKSDMFPSFEGPALGQAMMQARQAQVEYILKNRLNSW
jgi:tRNA nucleotidyltransferase/poly(A) polymerase